MDKLIVNLFLEENFQLRESVSQTWTGTGSTAGRRVCLLHIKYQNTHSITKVMTFLEGRPHWLVLTKSKGLDIISHLKVLAKKVCVCVCDVWMALLVPTYVFYRVNSSSPFLYWNPYYWRGFASWACSETYTVKLLKNISTGCWTLYVSN